MMRNRRLGVALAALAGSLMGCGREPGQGGGPTPAGGGPGASGAAAPAGGAAITRAELDRVTKASRAYRLALIVKTRNNPFFDPMIKSAEATARSLGVSLE